MHDGLHRVDLDTCRRPEQITRSTIFITFVIRATISFVEEI